MTEYSYRQIAVGFAIASDRATQYLAREMQVTMAGTQAQQLASIRGDNARSAAQCRRWAKYRKRKALAKE